MPLKRKYINFRFFWLSLLFCLYCPPNCDSWHQLQIIEFNDKIVFLTVQQRNDESEHNSNSNGGTISTNLGHNSVDDAQSYATIRDNGRVNLFDDDDHIPLHSRSYRWQQCQWSTVFKCSTRRRCYNQISVVCYSWTGLFREFRWWHFFEHPILIGKKWKVISPFAMGNNLRDFQWKKTFCFNLNAMERKKNIFFWIKSLISQYAQLKNFFFSNFTHSVWSNVSR